MPHGYRFGSLVTVNKSVAESEAPARERRPCRGLFGCGAAYVAEEERWQGYGEAVRQIEAREWLESMEIEAV